VRRVRRALTVLLLLLAVAAPARAAGTGGIEVSPYPGVVDGHQVTAFHVKVPTRGSVAVRYSLRNTTGKPAHGRLYAASAVSDGHGGWTIGGAGSTDDVDLDDQQVDLAPNETRLSSFRVEGPAGRRAAVVIEVKQGSVVTRAATLVYLEHGRTVPVPVLLAGIAVLLLLASGAAVWRVRRKRPATPAG
jgi:hypothetical protein